MRIILAILFFLISCSGNNHQGFLKTKNKNAFEFKPEPSTDYIKVSIGDKVIIDTNNRYDTTTRGLKSNEIPKEVFKKTNLISLSISGMDCDAASNGQSRQCWMIKEIPHEIKDLKNLEILELPLNAISNLPDEIKLLKNLKIIDLTDNKSLSNIDKLIELTNLEELYLFGCNISKFPVNIGSLSKLKELGLTGNPIEKGELERINRLLPNCRIIFDD